MKVIQISKFKARLSEYLRRAGRGEELVVVNRHEPVASIGPAPRTAASSYERLVREGKVLPPTRRRGQTGLTRLRRRVDIQRFLEEVREDAM
jgi:prevent-host-death family protein